MSRPRRPRAPPAVPLGEVVHDAPPAAPPLPPDPRVVAAAERILGALLGTAIDILMVLDEQGTVLAFNRALSVRLGAPPERILDSCVFDWLAPEVAEVRRARLAEAARTGRVATYADRARGIFQEHTIVPIPDEDGRYTLFLVLVRDVTAYRTAEVRLASALASGEIGVWEHDLETGRSMFNGEYLASLGYDAADRAALALDVRPLFPPEDLGIVLEIIEGYRTGTRSEHEGESRILTRDREVRWMLSRGHVEERDASGRPIRIAGTYRDVTARRRAEAERRALEQQLQQAQKMESLGRLAGGIAHDLNNLLTPVLGYAELLLDDPGLGERARSRLQAIATAARGASDLSGRLLAYGRKQVLDLKPTALNRVVLDFHAMIGRILGEDVRVALDLDPCLPTVLADASQIQQVLMNLAVNSRDAMPSGGTLGVRTAVVRVGPDEVLRHPWLEPATHALLEVSDTGTGMDEATRAHLFEPFFTTKERGKGTGLGLSTVWFLVRQHRGSIEVASAPGAGTTVRILLPLADPGEVPAPPPEVPRSRPSRRETVLVVEDEAVVRALVADALEAAGYHVLQAEDGLAGLAVASGYGGTLDLLVTDVIMPRLNGRDLFTRLEGSMPSLRVLYMSGYDDDVLTRQGRLGPGTTWLPKPFTIPALLAKVRAALDA